MEKALENARLMRQDDDDGKTNVETTLI